MDISVVVGTFGEASWAELARARAIPSAVAAGPTEVIHEHAETLAAARNAGAARASTEWLCFLDADDELEPGFLPAIAAASGDLRAPAVRYVVPGEPDPAPLVFADRDIAQINPCVIGTPIRRELFHAAGGFEEWRAWEDWALFRRAWLLGATIEHVPAAVYLVTVNPAGRNSTVDRPNELHREILQAHRAWTQERKRAR